MCAVYDPHDLLRLPSGRIIKRGAVIAIFPRADLPGQAVELRLTGCGPDYLYGDDADALLWWGERIATRLVPDEEDASGEGR
jgi:hypothetical protein